MKVESEVLLLPQRPASAWRLTAAAIGAAIVAIVAMYWSTASSLVAIWGSSQTYTHGYVILPLVAFLLWEKRSALARLAPTPDFMGLALLAVAGLAWLVGRAAQVQVVQQYAMVAMIPAVVIAFAGRTVGRTLAFPLAFLLFAVPFGEAFVPHLMNWTADFTVRALQLTGIPVYREGTFFEVPTGRWSVVEACSGIRYVIASVTIGTLYAYLTYRKLWKRLAFVALSIGVPVLANFLRAYMIVMIGHLSNMKLAVGIDHLIYGWIFFGVVMLILFWLGSSWRDAPEPRPAEAGPFVAPPDQRHLAAIGVAFLALIAVWPVYAGYLDRQETGPLALAAPMGRAGWQRDGAPFISWSPEYSGARASVSEVYRKDARAVLLYVGYYRNQRQGSELVSWQNAIVASSNPLWERVGEAQRREQFGEEPFELRQTRVRSRTQRLLVWDWYRIAGEDTSNPYFAKVLLARDRLLGRPDDSVAIIVATPYEGRSDAAEQTLREFAKDMLPAIDAALVQAKEGALEP